MSSFQNGSIVYSLLSTVTSGGTTSLSASSKQYQIFTGSSTHTVRLPDATTMKNGMVFTIINDSTGALTINYNDNSLAATIDPGKSKDFALMDNSSANGSFDISVNSTGGGGASTSDLNLLKAGQVNSFSALSVPLSFNPEEIGANVWLSSAPVLSSINQAPAPFTLNYYMYAAGGFGGGASAVVSRFDDTNTYWMARTSMTNARYFAGSFAQGAFGYVVGGQTGSNAGLSFNEQYNDATNLWASKATLINPSTNAFAFALGNYGFNAGGTDGSSTVVATNQMYDPANNSWSLRSPLLTVQSYAQGSAVNDKGYAVTGENAGSAVAIVQKFSHDLNTWQNVASTASNGSRASAASNAAFLYKIGGNSTSSGLEEYADFANLWTNKANLITAVASTYAGSVNGSIYVIGTGGSTAVQKYSNGNNLLTAISKKSNSIPTNILALAKIRRLEFTTAAQIRTDGDNWKVVTANEAASILRQGETLSTKFLPYGLAYVAGGAGPASSYTSFATTEYYNPTANVWTLRGNMITGRAQCFAWAQGGAGFVTGGNGPSLITHAALTSTEKFDEEANTFSSKAVLPVGAGNGAALSILGFGYVWGGGPFGDTIGTTPTANYKYDDALNSWSTKTLIPAAFAQQTAWTLFERGYMTSGGPDTGGSNQAIGYVYNPVNDAWLSIANAPSSDRQVHGHAANGYGYRVAGVNVSNNATHKYDSTANSWSTVAVINANGTNGAGLSSGGIGYSVNNDSGGTQSEAYNDTQNVWVTKASTNSSRRQPACNFTPGSYRNYEMKMSIPKFISGTGGGAIVASSAIPTALSNGDSGFALEGSGYFAGGYNGGYNAPAYRFDQETAKWTPIASLPTGRSSNGGFALLGYGYSTGGFDGGSSLTDVERLNPVTKTWTVVAAMNTAKHSHGSSILNGFGYASQGSVNGTLTGDLQQYNPATNAWATKTSGSVFSEVQANGLKGLLYTTAGHNGGVPTNNHNAYNDVSNAWIAKANLATARRAPGKILTSSQLMVAGGTGFSSVEKYNPDNNLWSYEHSLAGNRDYITSFSIAGIGYLAGGSGVTTMEAYVPFLNNILAQVALDVT